MLTFGNALENKLQKIAREAKKQKEADRKVASELNKWMTSADDPTKARGRFRDPMSRMK